MLVQLWLIRRLESTLGNQNPVDKPLKIALTRAVEYGLIFAGAFSAPHHSVSTMILIQPVPYVDIIARISRIESLS